MPFSLSSRWLVQPVNCSVAIGWEPRSKWVSLWGRRDYRVKGSLRQPHVEGETSWATIPNDTYPSWTELELGHSN